MAYRVVTPPQAEPVTVAQARVHLRQEAPAPGDPPLPDSDDMLLKISAAREMIEDYTGLALADRTLEVAYDAFPAGAVLLEGGHVKSVVEVQFVDPSTGILAAVPSTDYALDNWQQPAWLLLGSEYAAWPYAMPVANAVRIRYVVGPPGPVPAVMITALLTLVGHLCRERDGAHELPRNVLQMLNPHRTGLGV